MHSRRLSFAALFAAAVVPAGIAVADIDQPGSADAGPVLRAPLAGHATVAGQLHAAARRVRRAKRAHQRTTVPPELQRIAECESHGNPRAIGGGGMYRGAYQFSESTWASLGGKGDPAKASMAEQTRRAAVLYRRSGPSQWPVCAA